MIKRTILAALILLAGRAEAQVGRAPWQASSLRMSAPTYVGPGDAVPGALAWYGLRAYSAATRGTKAITVELASTATQDINSLAISGALDIASVNAFAGTDATCTGTISGTTLSVTSCTGTLHVRDTLTGAGIVQPSYITAIGSCATPPGTCTLNATQTVSVATTITAQQVLYVVRAYDQSGANKCSSAACDATVGLLAAPQLIPNCGNALPCLRGLSGSSSLLSGTITWPAMPTSVSWVASTIATTTSTMAVFGASGNDVESGVQVSSGIKAYGYAGGASIIDAPFTDNARHAVQVVFNSASSVVNVDGADTTGTIAVLNPTGGVFWGQNFSGSPYTGFSMELGVYGSALSSGNRASLCHNQYAYWATATSC